MTVKTFAYGAALAERLKCSLEAARSLVTGATLKVRIESLEAELAKLEATAAGHRADYERERDRADRLVIELLKATATATNEMAAKLEGEIAALRLAAEAGLRADVMAARGALDRLAIGVGEVRSVSADRRLPGSHDAPPAPGCDLVGPQEGVGWRRLGRQSAGRPWWRRLLSIYSGPQKQPIIGVVCSKVAIRPNLTMSAHLRR
jgi:hypothetical protein